MSRLFLSAASILVLAASAHAGPDDFGPGPLIPEYGQIAGVDIEMEIPADTEFRVAFDVAAGADAGELNRTLTSAARFLNMHVANGVPAEDIHVAVVVHGSAVRDVSGERVYASEHGETPNANPELIAALQANGVEIYVCGQSAAWYGVGNEDLLPGVTMSLSAMTSHALLQQDGYSLNPF
jgi:intracellular sulfur oxidation DsrE/DsrF family protein